MQVFSTFENTGDLELALSKLEEKGIKKENIFAVPLDNRKEERRLFDTIHRSDGVSLMDVGAALATAFAVIGASIGFSLEWGPIYWGIIGAILGFIIGFGIKLFIYKVLKKKQRLLHGKQTEIIVIIECDEKDVEMVEKVLWEQFALGMAKIK